MLMYPKINPVALSIGVVKIHWYGIMYLLGFLFFLYGGRWHIKHYKDDFWTNEKLDVIFNYILFGVIIGGRIGYCLFYQPMFYLHHPLEILKIYHGGMSFHGGLLGVLFASYLVARKYGQSVFVITDFASIFIGIGLFCGRIGNFINGELWGRISTAHLPWLMVFPQSGTMLPRHPSQLYEALFEGLVLFVILWWYNRKRRLVGQSSALFLIIYGIFRFILEFFREPDYFLQWLVQRTGLSMGQFLCIPMVIFGVILFWHASYRKQSK